MGTTLNKKEDEIFFIFSSSFFAIYPSMASRRYTDEQVIKFAKEVQSCASLIRKLGLKSAGGNFIHMKKTIQRLKIDTSHWTGQLWSKGQKL